MSKPRDVSGKGSSQGGQDPAAVWPPPLKPRPALFVMLGIILVALFAVMVVLYVTTIYPNPH